MWTYRGDEPTVVQWLGTISVGHESHQLAARSTRRHHRVLGVVTIVLAGAAAAAAFAALLSDAGPWLEAAAGVLAAVAAITALLHTMADDAGVIAAHQRAGAEYGKIRRELEQAILSERITDDRLSEIRAEWTRVEQSAPSVPGRATRRAAGRVEILAPPVAVPVDTTAPAPVAVDDEPVKELTAG